MHSLLDRAQSQAAWENYAGLGPEEARFTLHEHPELVGSISEPVLHHVPEVAIPLLLTEAIGDSRTLHSHPDHALRLIEDWIKREWPGTGEATRRRKSLLAAAQVWVDSGEDVQVGLHAMSIALMPGFESHSTDPVLGDRVTLRFGLLPLPELEEIAKLWPSVLETHKAVNEPDLRYVVNMISDWVYPQRFTRGQVPAELHDRTREQAKRMLRDIVGIGHESAGLMHRVRELAEELEIDLGFSADSDFDVLFPRVPRNWTEYIENQGRAIEQLAERWAADQPRSVMLRINQLEQEAKIIGEGNRQTPWLVRELAERITNPLEWIEAITDADASGDLVAPFILRASTMAVPNWESVAIACLSKGGSRYATASLILTMREPPDRVLEAALQSLDGMAKHVECDCLRDAIPLGTVRRLLKHDDDAIASHAAIGVWVADPRGIVAEDLYDDWVSAVLRGDRREYWLGEIFKDKAELGFEFLRNELRSNHRFWSSHNHATREALNSLSVEQRRRLMSELPDDFWSTDTLAMLIGDHVQLFRELLDTPRLKQHHLAPLRGHPHEGNWTERAKVALDSGIDPKSIAAAAFRWTTVWRGKESEMWKDWVAAFERIETDNDERIRDVAGHGIQMANNNRENALRQERAEETYGRP